MDDLPANCNFFNIVRKCSPRTLLYSASSLFSNAILLFTVVGCFALCYLYHRCIHFVKKRKEENKESTMDWYSFFLLRPPTQHAHAMDARQYRLIDAVSRPHKYVLTLATLLKKNSCSVPRTFYTRSIYLHTPLSAHGTRWGWVLSRRRSLAASSAQVSGDFFGNCCRMCDFQCDSARKQLNLSVWTFQPLTFAFGSTVKPQLKGKR